MLVLCPTMEWVLALNEYLIELSGHLIELAQVQLRTRRMRDPTACIKCTEPVGGRLGGRDVTYQHDNGSAQTRHLLHILCITHF
jgi:hypothetical protein